MRIIKFVIRDFYWRLLKRRQRFIRGYACDDVWNINTWFIETLEPMLRHLQKNHCGFPGEYTDEEWTTRIGKMADLLHHMDEWNVIKELYDGDYMKMKEIYETMDKNKNEFFEMFSKDFYALWD